MTRKRIAFAGASARASIMYAEPLAKDFQDVVEFVGVHDVNQGRCRLLGQRCGIDIPVFADFDAMMKTTKPDLVIVTTVDRFHHEYIIRSLDFGCDVVTEKPMTIDEGKAKEILAAEQRSGHKVTVTFNYRFAPFNTRIRELIKEGQIGTPLSVHFEWMLDTSHGADYFRRWHRQKKNSGGLLVHKSTHHFDLVNWWIDDQPEVVNAFGDLRYYGKNGPFRGERCIGCAHAKECRFYWDMRTEPVMVDFYYDNEGEDGYRRDGCVYDDEIDIEDTMSVQVKYKRGALMSYTLTAYAPYEGFRLVINGTDGRLEAEDFHGSVGAFAKQSIWRLRLYNRRNEEITIKVPEASGGHGGGDQRLLEMTFRGGMPDPLKHAANSGDGARSILVGVAGNRSIREKRPVRIDELLP
jgi:predicted dehydrogenase